jgi:hypothetical protein
MRVELREQAVLEYLDKAIRSWRDRRDDPLSNRSEALMSEHYIDAFQSVRVSLFGEVLP